MQGETTFWIRWKSLDDTVLNCGVLEVMKKASYFEIQLHEEADYQVDFQREKTQVYLIGC